MQKQAVAENTEIVVNFLKSFCTWMDQSKGAPKEADLEKYLSKSFQIKRDDHFQAKNLSEYLERINTLRETYSSCAIATPSTVFGADNKVAVKFEPAFSETEGEDHSYLIMAIATIENGKIASWDEISHAKS